MSNSTKNAVYGLALLTLMLAVYVYRNVNQMQLMKAEGKTMGTTYTVKYLDANAQDYGKEIDSILVKFNECLSTYIPTSEISVFNAGNEISFKLPFFYPVLQASKEIHRVSEGAFDPTVMPLVKSWGFGPSKKDSIPQQKVDSLLKFVDFNLLTFDEKKLSKSKAGVQIDFNAIAQGYATDVIEEFLRSKGIENYMIDIGKEIICRGVNEKQEIWKIGIENPKSDENEEIQSIQAILQVKNKAIATSGNYRNFYVKDGKRYAHTINPKSGYPVQHSLLSATVIADKCMTADAYATVCMVLGKEKALEMIAKHKLNLEVFFVYEEDGKIKTYASVGLEKMLVK